MNEINSIAAVLCVALAAAINIQCFKVAVKMTATANHWLSVLVGVASFGALFTTFLVLGGILTAYWYAVAGLAVVAAGFSVMLRTWTRGMPVKYDTDRAPLQTEG
jgi:hypothetical protein